jgi:predicted nucleic acid-binding protein
MIVLDSSVLISFFSPEEELHLQARKILKANDLILIPDQVVSETVTVLKSRKNFSAATKCIDFITNTEGIEIFHIDPITFSKSLNHFKINKNKLSLVDTILLVLNKNKKYKISTFDLDLKKLIKTKT